MGKHLWSVVCLAGVVVMAAALLTPGIVWDAGWWRHLEHAWWQFADARGWGVGFREGFILAGMSAGAITVIGGLLMALVGRGRGTMGRPSVVPPPGPEIAHS